MQDQLRHLREPLSEVVRQKIKRERSGPAVLLHLAELRRPAAYGLMFEVQPAGLGLSRSSRNR